MNTKTTIAAIAAVSVLGAGTVAFADGHGHKRGHGSMMKFEDVDTNGDGKLSRSELEAHGAKRFAEADANNDGKLTKDEFVAKGKERAEKRFEKMLSKKDADGDGALSADEMKPSAERAEKMFSRLDKDGDGFISKEEAEKMRKHGKRHGKKGEKSE